MTDNRIAEVKMPVHMCKIFNCDSRRGNFCCAECRRKRTCKNPCLNSPKQCGQVIEKAGEPHV